MLLSGVPTATHAQTTTPAANEPTTTTETRSIPETTIVPTEQTGKPGTLTNIRQTRIINLAANISNRIDASIRRLTNIADRLESRMRKLDARGIDTTDAATHVAQARQTLARLTERMSSIDQAVYDSVTSQTPRDTWQQVKPIFQNAATDLPSAHAALRAAVAALQAAPARQTETSTSTDEHTLTTD